MRLTTQVYLVSTQKMSGVILLLPLYALINLYRGKCIFYMTLNTDIKIKVKCILVQALRLCTGRTAHRGSRVIALLFHDHDTRGG